MFSGIFLSLIFCWEPMPGKTKYSQLDNYKIWNHSKTQNYIWHTLKLNHVLFNFNILFFIFFGLFWNAGKRDNFKRIIHKQNIHLEMDTIWYPLLRSWTSFLMFSISVICFSSWSLRCRPHVGSIVSFRIESTASWYLFPIPSALSRSTTAALISSQTWLNSALDIPPVECPQRFLVSRSRSMFAETDLSVESGVFPQPW